MGQEKSQRRKRPLVVSKHGQYRFQTGMVTASLLQRGLSMADAFAISNALKDEIASLKEISTADLELRLQQVLDKWPGIDASGTAPITGEIVTAETPMVKAEDGTFPFSRGILLRYLVTAGLGIEPAMDMGSTIDHWLRDLGEPEVSEERIEAEVVRQLTTHHSEAHARRYRLTGWIRRSTRPVIILIGGSTGTGKSTLAMELAFRLGIRLVTSTDMIRETLRTVLSPEVVPGLHDHSFRGIVQDGQALSNPEERVLVGFRQQAAQVSVGIRGVIRRAVRENAHMIIEGTHIQPPFEQYIPAGVDVYSAGFILAVPEESRHRARFPKRATNQSLRDATTYLDAFQSVRWIHDELLRDAEDTQAVIVANEQIDLTITGVVEYLSQTLPLAESASDASMGTVVDERLADAPRTLMLILDGLADEPNPALGGQTPLGAAHIPYLNLLAGSGGQGLILTTDSEGVAPSTDEGLLALLGQAKLKNPMGRGLLEALGQGLPLPQGAVLFRGNMATLQPDGTLADRRAGRIRAGVNDLLADLRNVVLPGGLRGHVYPGHEHRVVVMLQGQGLSPAVSDSDPGGEAVVQRIQEVRPLDDSPEAARTAQALKALLEIARQKLESHPHNAERAARGMFPANCLITRGAGSVDQLPTRRHRIQATALVSACPTALGVARAVGLQPATSAEMTGNLDTNLDEKFETAATLLAQRHFVTIHFKGTDIAAHDRRPIEKRNFISQIDAALGRFLDGHPDIATGLRVVVSADHGTSSITGNHLADPVPLLLSTWDQDAEPAEFSEESATLGAIGVLRPGELTEVLWGG